MNYREILEDFVNNEDTEYCYDWHGFDYKIILPCIEQLLKNENNLQSKIDKAIEYYETHQQECVIGRNRDDKLIKDYYLPSQFSKKVI